MDKFLPPNERRQTGIGLLMDRVGLRLINVLNRNGFNGEVTFFFDHLSFGFVAK